MNWDAIGAVAELLSGAIVVVTLAYLAMQIRNAERATRIASVAQTAEATDRWLSGIVGDADLCSLYHRGMREYSELSGTERQRFRLLVVQFLRSVEGAWVQRELGMLSDEQWHGYHATTSLILGSPGGQAALARLEPFFTEKFLLVLQDMVPLPPKTEHGAGA